LDGTAADDVLDAATRELNCLCPDAVAAARRLHVWTSWRMQGLAYWDAMVFLLSRKKKNEENGGRGAARGARLSMGAHNLIDSRPFIFRLPALLLLACQLKVILYLQYALTEENGGCYSSTSRQVEKYYQVSRDTTTKRLIHYDTMPEDKVYDELVGFLGADRADLQKAAVEATLGVNDPDGLANLIKAGAIEPLCRLSSRPGEIGNDALSALVKLSSTGPSADQACEDLVNCGATNRMTEIALTSPPAATDGEALEAWRKRINFALAVLANVTRTERGAVEFCGKSMPNEAIVKASEDDNVESKLKPAKPTLTLLLSRFLLPTLIKKAPNGEEGDENAASSNDQNAHLEEDENAAAKSDDPFQHMAAVLMNATQVEQGRKFVMKLQHKKKDVPPTSVLQLILPQLRSPNKIRRRGIAGAVKNCCFDKDSSYWLLNEVDIVKQLLYPLAGPEELDPDDKIGLDPDLWLEGPDKVREPDEVTRQCLVEAILLLLASGRRSRESIRQQKTYVILKMADMVEESERVSESISECVQYLRRDEEGCEEGTSDRQVEEATRGRSRGELLALPAPAASAAVDMRPTNADDFDGVD
jgi:hypothetical protein